MSFTYIGPDRLLHYVIALSIFLGGTLTWLCVYLLYNKYFIDGKDPSIQAVKDMEDIKSIILTMAILLFFVGFILIFNYYEIYNNRLPKNKRVKIPKPVSWFANDVLAIGEYIHLGLYAFMLYRLSTLVALPKLNEVNNSKEPPSS